MKDFVIYVIKIKLVMNSIIFFNVVSSLKNEKTI